MPTDWAWPAAVLEQDALVMLESQNLPEDLSAPDRVLLEAVVDNGVSCSKP